MTHNDGRVTAALHDYAPHPDGRGAMLQMVGIDFVTATGAMKVLLLAPHEACALAEELLTLAYRAGEAIAELGDIDDRARTIRKEEKKKNMKTTGNHDERAAAARLSQLDCHDSLLDDIINWARGVRRNGEPVSTADLARTLVRLASRLKDADATEALASLLATAVQRLVAER
jgi:hypothetical protein